MENMQYMQKTRKMYKKNWKKYAKKYAKYAVEVLSNIDRVCNRWHGKYAKNAIYAKKEANMDRVCITFAYCKTADMTNMQKIWKQKL